ncbi:sulfatase-like hydrolase/transferase [Candidatus Poribacteria bacterium]|nr:sulfatase-like hydrolase/transferase [Candidatus Poribacteria bacterium]
MEKAEKPNILFMLADDMGWGDVSYHGSEIRTPNIDRLKDSGVELDQHYVCPMCTPTRASLLTGRHPGRFGRHATTPSNAPVLPDGYETLATSLRNCGYDTGLFGKWHLGSSPEFCPNKFGFNTSYGSLAGGVDPYNHCYKRGPYSATWHRNGEIADESGHVTDLIAKEAVEWIDSRKGPWFCYVPFTAVHIPVKAPQHWIDQYEFEKYDDIPIRDRSFKKYAAYASQMDHAVGQLVESVVRRCEMDKTIIVFTSDNGAIPEYSPGDLSKYPGWQEATPRLGSNLPLRGQKAQLYEGGIRTPSLISWPSVLEPRKIEHPMHIVDWMPSFTKLVNYTPKEDPMWDGKDIWPLISGEEEEAEERSIFWNFRGTEFCLRRGNWKLITNENMNPKNSQLYNISEDPYETHDFIKEKPDMVRDMLDEISQERQLDGVSVRDDIEMI